MTAWLVLALSMAGLVQEDPPVPPRPDREGGEHRPPPLSEEDRARLEKEMAQLSEALKDDPENAEAWLKRGMIQMRLGRKEEALKDWDHAVEINPALKEQVMKFKSGPGRPDGKGNKRPQKPLDKAAVDEVKAFLKENDPEMLRRLNEAVEGGREEEAQRFTREAYGRMQELKQLKEKNPEEYERMTKMRTQERRSFELGDKIRKLPADQKDEREKLVKELEEVLSTLFDLREEQRAREVRELNRRLEELKASLEKRQASKAAIVEKRLKEMTGEQDRSMDW